MKNSSRDDRVKNDNQRFNLISRYYKRKDSAGPLSQEAKSGPEITMQFRIKQVNIAWMLDIWDSSRCSSKKTTLLHSIRLNAKRVLLIWGEEPLPLEIMATMHFKPQEIMAGCSNQRVKMIYLGWEEICFEMTISGSKTRLETHPLSRTGSSTSTCRTFQSQSQRNDKMRL